jgi:hypothetical protein
MGMISPIDRIESNRGRHSSPSHSTLQPQHTLLKSHRQYQLTGRILGVGGFALVYEAICLRDAKWEDGSHWTFRVTKVRKGGPLLGSIVRVGRLYTLACTPTN